VTPALTPHERLAKAAAVKSFGNDAEYMLDFVRYFYVESVLNNFPEKFYLHDEFVSDEHTPERLRRLLALRAEARALGTDLLPDTQLQHYDEGLIELLTEQQWPRYQLSSCVKTIEKIWREHGGKGKGSYYSPIKSQHDGPLLRLLLELFEQTGLPEDCRPSRHTLHNVIQDNRRPRPTV